MSKRKQPAPAARKKKQPTLTARGSGAASTAPEGLGVLSNYHIEWSMRTEGEDYYYGGHDFKRSIVTGKLVFGNGCDDKDEEEAGLIFVTQYRMHYMGNNGINKAIIFDETQEGMDLYQAVIADADDGFEEEFQGDLQVVERMLVYPAHRGHGLGLFMLEAADNVINGHMSLQVLKPYPLQFERDDKDYGFPTPPGGGREKAVKAACAKITAYYGRLGFAAKGQTGYMLRWNGFQLPSLSQAMRK